MQDRRFIIDSLMSLEVILRFVQFKSVCSFAESAICVLGGFISSITQYTGLLARTRQKHLTLGSHSEVRKLNKFLKTKITCT